MISKLIGAADGVLWGIPMPAGIMGSGICFTIAPKGFQVARFGDMWGRIWGSGSSTSGASSFASFIQAHNRWDGRNLTEEKKNR